MEKEYSTGDLDEDLRLAIELSLQDSPQSKVDEEPVAITTEADPPSSQAQVPKPPLTGNALLASLAAERHARRGLRDSHQSKATVPTAPMTTTASPAVLPPPQDRPRLLSDRAAPPKKHATGPLLPPAPHHSLRALRYCPIALTHISAFARAGETQANRYVPMPAL